MIDFRKLSNKDAAYHELIDAKQVEVKKDRTCSKCGKMIPAHHKCITASRLIDKKFNKTYTYIIDSKLNINNFRFVKQRHWVCLQCANSISVKPKISYNELLESGKFSEEQQLEFAVKAYRNKEITAKEFQDIEDSLIDSIAFRDAIANDY